MAGRARRVGSCGEVCAAPTGSRRATARSWLACSPDARGHLPGAGRGARRRAPRPRAAGTRRRDRPHRGHRRVRQRPAHLPRPRGHRAGLHHRPRVRRHGRRGRRRGELGRGRRPRPGLLPGGVRHLPRVPRGQLPQVRALADLRSRRRPRRPAGHAGRAGARAPRQPHPAPRPGRDAQRRRALRRRRDGHRLPRGRCRCARATASPCSASGPSGCAPSRPRAPRAPPTSSPSTPSTRGSTWPAASARRPCTSPRRTRARRSRPPPTGAGSTWPSTPSGDPRALDLAIRVAANCGTVSVVGVYAERAEVHMGLAWIKALTLHTGQANVIGHLDRVLALMSAGVLDPAAARHPPHEPGRRARRLRALRPPRGTEDRPGALGGPPAARRRHAPHGRGARAALPRRRGGSRRPDRARARLAAALVDVAPRGAPARAARPPGDDRPARLRLVRRAARRATTSRRWPTTCSPCSTRSGSTGWA